MWHIIALGISLMSTCILLASEESCEYDLRKWLLVNAILYLFLSFMIANHELCEFYEVEALCIYYLIYSSLSICLLGILMAFVIGNIWFFSAEYDCSEEFQ